MNFKVGDKVRILLNLETLSPEEEDFLPWFAGRTGEVESTKHYRTPMPNAEPGDYFVVKVPVGSGRDFYLLTFSEDELQLVESSDDEDFHD